jgi:anti-sigma factor ChrR (cupin superfamily)
MGRESVWIMLLSAMCSARIHQTGHEGIDRVHCVDGVVSSEQGMLLVLILHAHSC